MKQEKSILKIGLIQQSNTPDIKENLKNLELNIADVADKGAQLVILQELHNSIYFCQVEDTDNFNLAEPIPGPSTDFSENWQKNMELYWLLLCSKNVRPDSTTTRL